MLQIIDITMSANLVGVICYRGCFCTLFLIKKIKIYPSNPFDTPVVSIVRRQGTGKSFYFIFI